MGYCRAPGTMNRIPSCNHTPTTSGTAGKRIHDVRDVFISLDGYSAPCLYRAVPAEWCLVVDF